MTTDQLLDPKQVAEWFALEERTVSNMAQRGQLPGFKVSSKAWRFSRGELMSWLERRRNQPRGEGEVSGA